MITRTGWWLAPGGPLALLSWEKAHLGKVYRYEGSVENGPGIYSNTYDVPPVPGLFDYRHLAVTAVTARPRAGRAAGGRPGRLDPGPGKG